jgi:hypothetical protein
MLGLELVRQEQLVGSCRNQHRLPSQLVEMSGSVGKVLPLPQEQPVGRVLRQVPLVDSCRNPLRQILRPVGMQGLVGMVQVLLQPLLA